MGVALVMTACGGGDGDAPEARTRPSPPTDNPAGEFPSEPTLRDDLSRPDSGWPRREEPDGSSTGHVAKRYEMTLGDGRALLSATAPVVVEPGNRGTFSEVELVPPSGGGGGLFCRASEDGSRMYAVTLSADGSWVVRRVEAGKATVLQEGRVPEEARARDGEPTLLRFICGTANAGETVSLVFTVNATPFFVVRDPRGLDPERSTRVGLLVARDSTSEPFTARFNNFAVILATPPAPG